MKTTIDQAGLECTIETDLQVAEMDENAFIDAMKMCTVKAQDGLVRSTVSLAILVVIGDILYKEAVADLM